MKTCILFILYYRSLHTQTIMNKKWGCKGHVEKLSIKLRKKLYIEKVTVINFISQNAMHKS
jgi:hypothetical protein